MIFSKKQSLFLVTALSILFGLASSAQASPEAAYVEAKRIRRALLASWEKDNARAVLGDAKYRQLTEVATIVAQLTGDRELARSIDQINGNNELISSMSGLGEIGQGCSPAEATIKRGQLAGWLENKEDVHWKKASDVLEKLAEKYLPKKSVSFKSGDFTALRRAMDKKLRAPLDRAKAKLAALLKGALTIRDNKKKGNEITEQQYKEVAEGFLTFRYARQHPNERLRADSTWSGDKTLSQLLGFPGITRLADIELGEPVRMREEGRRLITLAAFGSILKARDFEVDPVGKNAFAIGMNIHTAFGELDPKRNPENEKFKDYEDLAYVEAAHTAKKKHQDAQVKSRRDRLAKLSVEKCAKAYSEGLEKLKSVKTLADVGELRESRRHFQNSANARKSLEAEIERVFGRSAR